MTDIDGNEYKTITIGTQTWMAENLRTTKYRNGDPITYIGGFDWGTSLSGAYCWINNNVAFKVTYGGSYNWFAIADNRNIAPVGWHVPTDTEWATLTDYLGGTNVAGDKLKETGTMHWPTPNSGATNSSGFTALPGGYRETIAFMYGDGSGYWWRISALDGTNAGFIKLQGNNVSVGGEIGRAHV